MTSNRKDELFSRLEKSSATYADRATELSNMILEFEERLDATMEGKFSAFVTHQDPPLYFNLGYGRVDGRWRLCFTLGKQNVNWRPLEEAAVRYKILGGGLFENLLEEMVGEQEAQTEELDKALGEISPFLDVETDQEGGN